MDDASPLDGRIVHLELDLIVSPPSGAPVGHTDAGAEFGKRLALQAGLLARQMAGEGCHVIVERKITVY